MGVSTPAQDPKPAAAPAAQTAKPVIPPPVATQPATNDPLALPPVVQKPQLAPELAKKLGDCLFHPGMSPQDKTAFLDKIQQTAGVDNDTMLRAAQDQIKTRAATLDKNDPNATKLLDEAQSLTTRYLPLDAKVASAISNQDLNPQQRLEAVQTLLKDAGITGRAEQAKFIGDVCKTYGKQILDSVECRSDRRETIDSLSDIKHWINGGRGKGALPGLDELRDRVEDKKNVPEDRKEVKTRKAAGNILLGLVAPELLLAKEGAKQVGRTLKSQPDQTESQ